MFQLCHKLLRFWQLFVQSLSQSTYNNDICSMLFLRANHFHCISYSVSKFLNLKKISSMHHRSYMKESNKLKNIFVSSKTKPSEIEKLFAECHLNTIYFKIFISYQQIISIISGIQVPWPFKISTFFFSFAYLTFFTQHAPSLECLYEGKPTFYYLKF